MKLSILSALLLTDVSAFAPSHNFATTVRTSRNAVADTLQEEDTELFSTEFLGTDLVGVRNASGHYSLQVGESKQEIEGLIVGRLVGWPTAILSCTVILIGIVSQFIKKVLSDFVSDLDPQISTAIAWILAFLPFYYLPFPINLIPSIICIYFGASGIPSEFPPTISDGEDDDLVKSITPIVIEIFKAVRAIVYLTLSLVEGLIDVSPIPIEDQFFFWNLLFRREIEVLKPEEYGINGNDFPNEKWIYINGIRTTKDQAIENAKDLHRIFDRPVNVVCNPTKGVFVDFVECIIAKSGLLQYGPIKPDEKLKEVLRKSLTTEGIEKIVLISHSQGTIMTGKALTELSEEDYYKNLMRERLEVYNFAPCAHDMPGDNVNYLEVISNRGDVVAWLGHLFPEALKQYWFDTKLRPSDYPNTISVIEEESWGHGLLKHYLGPMQEDGLFKNSKLAKEYMT